MHAYVCVCVCESLPVKEVAGNMSIFTCPLHFESVKKQDMIFLSYSSLEVLVCV